MLRDAWARKSSSQQENREPDAEIEQSEQNDLKLDDEEEVEHSFDRPGLAALLGGRMMPRIRHTVGKFDHLHPFTQLLSISNVQDCVKLEDEAFPTNERCSREKFIYRLATCPELSLGLFSRPTLSEAEGNKGIDTKHRLIAHIVATRTPSRSVTDSTMDFPADWKQRRSSLPKVGEAEPLGHQEQGGTVALHSLAVTKEHQHKGLGTILLKAYIERIKSAKIAERISLLAHDDLIKFYQTFGFVDEGPSEAKFGGTHWNSMILEFSEQQMDD